MYFILRKTVETLHKINPSVFLSLLDVHTFCHALYIWPMMNEVKDGGGKELELPCLSLSFIVTIFSISAWLREGMNRKVTR